MAETALPHQQRYVAAVRAWEAARGQRVDRHARALLALATADAGLWAWLQPRLEAPTERVDLDHHAATELNASQRLLLAVARALYGEESAVNLASIADDLNEQQFAAVLAVLQAYREDTEPDLAPPMETDPTVGA